MCEVLHNSRPQRAYFDIFRLLDSATLVYREDIRNEITHAVHALLTQESIKSIHWVLVQPDDRW